jgi:hypothetical protein
VCRLLAKRGTCILVLFYATLEPALRTKQSSPVNSYGDIRLSRHLCNPHSYSPDVQIHTAFLLSCIMPVPPATRYNMRTHTTIPARTKRASHSETLCQAPQEHGPSSMSHGSLLPLNSLPSNSLGKIIRISSTARPPEARRQEYTSRTKSGMSSPPPKQVPGVLDFPPLLTQPFH